MSLAATDQQTSAGKSSSAAALWMDRKAHGKRIASQRVSRRQVPY